MHQPVCLQGDAGIVQATICPEAAPDDAWQEAIARASRIAARGITAGVAARLAAEDASRRERQPAGEPAGSPSDAAGRGTAGGALPEFKTLAEDDLEAGLALQIEVGTYARHQCNYVQAGSAARPYLL